MIDIDDAIQGFAQVVDVNDAIQGFAQAVDVTDAIPSNAYIYIIQKTAPYGGTK